MALAGKHGKKKVNLNITCYLCGDKGHISRQCKKKSKLGKGKSGGKQKEMMEANAAADEFAFCGEDTALAVSPESWLADLACTSPIAWDHNIFIDYTSCFGKTPGLGRGTIQLQTTVEGKTSKITLKNVVHVPDALFNLILISHALEAGVAVLFSSPGVRFQAPNGMIIMEGRISNCCLT